MFLNWRWKQNLNGTNLLKEEILRSMNQIMRKVEYDKLTRKITERRTYFEKWICWADNIASTHLRNNLNNIILKYDELFKLTLHLSGNCWITITHQRKRNFHQKYYSSYNQHSSKINHQIVDFAISADHRIKLKECEKKNKYIDLARELKKLQNMKMTIVSIVIGAFSAVTKGLLKGLEDLEVRGWVETIQTSALLRTARILRRVLEAWGDLLSLKLQWKTIS